MKLTIEQLTQPSIQDNLDLAKIWHNERYQNALTAPITQENALFVARFNDRLLAACRVKISADNALITDFVVREVTRRRGVGHYLLTECVNAYPEIINWQAVSLSAKESGYDIAHLFLDYHQFSTSSEQPEVYHLSLAERE